jgi:hypothetical protein
VASAVARISLPVAKDRLPALAARGGVRSALKRTKLIPDPRGQKLNNPGQYFRLWTSSRSSSPVVGKSGNIMSRSCCAGWGGRKHGREHLSSCFLKDTRTMDWPDQISPSQKSSRLVKACRCGPQNRTTWKARTVFASRVHISEQPAYRLFSVPFKHTPDVLILARFGYYSVYYKYCHIRCICLRLIRSSKYRLMIKQIP